MCVFQRDFSVPVHISGERWGGGNHPEGDREEIEGIRRRAIDERLVISGKRLQRLENVGRLTRRKRRVLCEQVRGTLWVRLGRQQVPVKREGDRRAIRAETQFRFERIGFDTALVVKGDWRRWIDVHLPIDGNAGANGKLRGAAKAPMQKPYWMR